MTNQRLTLTTESGAPVADNQNAQTAGPAGPVLRSVQQLIRQLDPRDRERILERIVHPVGSRVHGGRDDEAAASPRI